MPGSRPTGRSTSGAAADPRACIREEQIASAAEAGLRSGDPLRAGADRARFGWLKLFADGTLASRTAALLEPIEAEEGGRCPRARSGACS